MIKFYHSPVVFWNKALKLFNNTLETGTVLRDRLTENVSEEVWQEQFQYVLVKSACAC